MKAYIKMKADKVAFFTSFAISLGLLIGGFFAPPQGEIHGSVLSATGILLGFATLAVGALAMQDGKVAKLTKGDMEINIGLDNTDEQ